MPLVTFGLPAARLAQPTAWPAVQPKSGVMTMRPPFLSTDFAESRIEDEPILGKVLRLPDGRIQSLTWWERLLVTLGLVNAKSLESRYAGRGLQA
jgi:hypothetical protein